ncbi:uncharacterized protein TNIN_88071 [Trichonephila inaurata madagascariensis]|uniref:THAP-type domain-containing protein n=1 Tax=Trichonephila inaurata madagascariensis TaxID=2747483 RepID=A0A8X6XGU4_9ARAC|nr:uncharacterized protein TNIN_88071 [Trichonephila inaurata madagascariensis]
MSPRCVARGCNSGKCERTCKTVTYYRFPLRNPILLKIWLRKINRKNFKPSARSRLCSDHFEENCFEYVGPEKTSVKRILKRNSIPTKFLKWEQRPPRRVFETCLDPCDLRSSLTSSDFSSSPTPDLSPNQTPSDLGPCQIPSDLGPCQIPSDLGPCQIPSDLGPCQTPSDLNPFLESSDFLVKDFCTLVEECCSAMFSKTSSNPEEHSEKLSKWQQTMDGFKRAFSEMFGKEKLIPENVPDDRTMVILTNFQRKRFFATFSFLEMDQIFQEKNNMRAVDQFFLFLIKLKTGLSNDILSIFFHISCDIAGEIFALVTDIMYRKLRLLKMFPTKERVLECMPLLFLHEYQDVRVIIDRVWFEIEKPKIENEDKITFCPQRKTNIVKGMVGIMPSGAIIFVTSLYCGNISDEHIFVHSRVMDYLEPNDVVIAENGFEVEKELRKISCELRNRNYLEDKIVFDSNAGEDSVSFERPLARFKQYKYFDNVISFKNVPFVNNLFFITCMLLNFLDYPDTLDL